MAESPVIRFRVKLEMKTTIDVLQKEWQFKTQTDTVVRLIKLGIVYKKERDREIGKIRDRCKELEIEPHELKLR